jgi:hypothetical protein
LTLPFDLAHQNENFGNRTQSTREIRKTCETSVEDLKGGVFFERPIHRRMIIKNECKKAGFEFVNWVYLAQCRD